MATSHSFSNLLDQQIILADGAMGTMFYNQGIFLNRCFDALNVENPQQVRKIHEAYVAAGVDLIETNTFGANQTRLAKYGLADEVEAINTAAVELARDVAGDRVLVAGAIGPLGVEMTKHGPMTAQQAYEVFSQQACVLSRAGVDLLGNATPNCSSDDGQ